MGIFDKLFVNIFSKKCKVEDLNKIKYCESNFNIYPDKIYIIDDNESLKYLLNSDNVILISGENISKFIFSKQKNNIRKVYIDLTLYGATDRDNNLGDGIDIFQYLYKIPNIQIKFLTSHDQINDNKYNLYKKKFKYYFNLNLDDYYVSKSKVNFDDL